VLSQRCTESHLRRILLPQDEWTPFPAGSDRAAWTNLPDHVQRICVQRGEVHLGAEWPSVPATALLEFVRTGSRDGRSADANVARNTLRDLLLAEAVEWQGRFLDDILNGVWSICDEASWTLPAALYIQKSGFGLPDTDDPIVDLFTAKTVMVMAAACHLVGPQLETISPHVVPRILRKIRNRAFNPLLQHSDFWWMGFGERIPNNWNPWICSNLLAGVLLLETDHDTRISLVSRIMQITDTFLDRHEPDGGCNEGPSYWDRSAGSLSELLVFLNGATGGAIDVFEEPLIRNLGRFLYQVHIDAGYFANFCDAPPVWRPPPAVLYQFGSRINDPKLKALGKVAWDRQLPHKRFSGKGMSRDFLTLHMWKELDAAPPATAPYVRDSWLPDTQIAVARDREGTPDGFCLAAKGGHNGESHNHNDVGNVMVYRDGKPVLVDVGVGTYTKQTFSEDRYGIWTMQSSYHSLPTINGTAQKEGASYGAQDVAYAADDQQAEISMDVSSAYPEEAGVDAWVRTATLQRCRSVTIVDRFALSRPSDDVCLSFITPCEVDVEEGGPVRLKERVIAEERLSGSAILSYDPGDLSVVCEQIVLDDENLTRFWGSVLTRILFRSIRVLTQDTWTFQLT